MKSQGFLQSSLKSVGQEGIPTALIPVASKLVGLSDDSKTLASLWFPLGPFLASAAITDIYFSEF